MYSSKQKAEIITKALKLLNTGYSFRAIARELKINRTTLYNWIREDEENIQLDAIARKELTNHFLEIQLANEEKIIILATNRLLETIKDAPPQIANNILNTALNNYRLFTGKETEIISVKNWSAFIDEIKSNNNL